MTNWAAFFEQGPVHPVPVDLLLLKTFGPDYYGWEPETLQREIRLTFAATPTIANFDCIQAARAVHTDNRFASDWWVFEKIVIGLNAEPVMFGAGQKPTVGQVMVAVDAIVGDPGLRGSLVFEDEVRAYMAAVVREDACQPVPELLAPYCKGFVPPGEPNDNASDDLEYFRQRRQLMYHQLELVGQHLKGS